MSLREQILDISRQNQIGELSPFFSAQLDHQISQGRFLPEKADVGPADLNTVCLQIISRLTAYREKTGAATVVLGMSGGVDSAVTAALFKAAGWRVIGYALPINQNPDETARGIEMCQVLGIEHSIIDLTEVYDKMQNHLFTFDDSLIGPNGKGQASLIRQGNIRARLRMITLYNMASKHGGIVASTDNFSELGAGFWTLHGDVGDVAPIQGLNKSWEVPMLAKMLGVPESTWRATPTDGLGISNGDEAQLGCSYLEWDLMVNWLFDNGPDFHSANEDYNDPRFNTVFEAVYGRMGKSWFKRMNPFNFDHPLHNNVDNLQTFESRFTVPQGI
jgi:nicotinamide-nucleotide amidase